MVVPFADYDASTLTGGLSCATSGDVGCVPSFDSYEDILNGHSLDLMQLSVIDSGVTLNFNALLYYQRFFPTCADITEGK